MKEELTEEEREKEEFAALKIQSVFRGHVAREEVKKMKSDKSEEKGEEAKWGYWLYPPPPPARLENMKK